MLKTWWYQREPREKRIIMIGGIMISVLMLDFFIWQPLSQAITQTRDTLTERKSLLAWTTHAKTKIDALNKAGFKSVVQPSGVLLVSIEQSLAKTGLSKHITNTSDQSGTSVSLSFSNVPFDELMDWLQALWVNHNIIMSNAHSQKSDIQGTVNATVTLINAN